MLLSPLRSITDVEEIARKTGHYQPFSAFIKMLAGAMNEERSDTFVDILTYGDLVALKSRRKAGSGAAAASSGNNKRYIILTHAGQERCARPRVVGLAAPAPPPVPSLPRGRVVASTRRRR